MLRTFFIERCRYFKADDLALGDLIIELGVEIQDFHDNRFVPAWPNLKENQTLQECPVDYMFRENHTRFAPMQVHGAAAIHFQNMAHARVIERIGAVPENARIVLGPKSGLVFCIRT
jgi:hypothetical protein